MLLSISLTGIILSLMTKPKTGPASHKYLHTSLLSPKIQNIRNRKDAKKEQLFYVIPGFCNDMKCYSSCRILRVRLQRQNAEQHHQHCRRREILTYVTNKEYYLVHSCNLHNVVHGSNRGKKAAASIRTRCSKERSQLI